MVGNGWSWCLVIRNWWDTQQVDQFVVRGSVSCCKHPIICGPSWLLTAQTVGWWILVTGRDDASLQSISLNIQQSLYINISYWLIYLFIYIYISLSNNITAFKSLVSRTCPPRPGSSHPVLCKSKRQTKKPSEARLTGSGSNGCGTRFRIPVLGGSANRACVPFWGFPRCMKTNTKPFSCALLTSQKLTKRAPLQVERISAESIVYTTWLSVANWC